MILKTATARSFLDGTVKTEGHSSGGGGGGGGGGGQVREPRVKDTKDKRSRDTSGGGGGGGGGGVSAAKKARVDIATDAKGDALNICC